MRAESTVISVDIVRYCVDCFAEEAVAWHSLHYHIHQHNKILDLNLYALTPFELKDDDQQ